MPTAPHVTILECGGHDPEKSGHVGRTGRLIGLNVNGEMGRLAVRVTYHIVKLDEHDETAVCWALSVKR